MFVPKPYFPQAAPRTNADPFLHDVALLPWATLAQGLPFWTDQTFLDLCYNVKSFLSKTSFVSPLPSESKLHHSLKVPLPSRVPTTNEFLTYLISSW